MSDGNGGYAQVPKVTEPEALCWWGHGQCRNDCWIVLPEPPAVTVGEIGGGNQTAETFEQVSMVQSRRTQEAKQEQIGQGRSLTVTLRNGAGVPGSSSVSESKTVPTCSIGQEAGRGSEVWRGAARDRRMR